jgi:acetyltransferase-like isoleucine patch superfamily enzyme
MSADIGADSSVDEDVRLGYGDGGPTVIGDRATIRSGSVVYADVEIGDDLTTGHRATVRSGSRLGDEVLLGSDVVLDGSVELGSRVSLQTGAYLPAETTVGDDVFVGPHAVLTNDPYPVRTDVDLVGPAVADDASIGANATILPEVTVGTGAFVAAGAVVTDDVPPDTLAVGSPATHRDLPAQLQGGNRLG